MKTFSEADLILNDDGTVYPDGQSQQVDECIALVSPGIPQRNNQVILYHDSTI